MELNGELVCKLLDNGMSAEQIADKHGITPRGVRNMASRHRNKQADSLPVMQADGKPTVPDKLILHQRQHFKSKRPQIRVSQKSYKTIDSLRRRTGMSAANIMDSVLDFVEPIIVVGEYEEP